MLCGGFASTVLCMLRATIQSCTLSADVFQAVLSTSAFESFHPLAAAVFALAMLPAYLVTILDSLGKCKQSLAPGLQSELCGWPSVDPLLTSDQVAGLEL